MNIPTLLLSLALLAVVALVLRNVIRQRKSGGCAGCPNASGCHKSDCH